jgi:DAK2 domain fusion protein YloV
MTGPVMASDERVGRAIGAARAALEARAAEVDDLNVFPVADGDTGSNMLATAAAVERAALATAGLPRAERCAALARAALVGARGNSGMILSQLVRGAAEVLAAGDGPVDGPTVARALRRASEAADAAVRRPVEGTMLTVARRAAEAAEESGAPDAETVLAAALAGGRRGVEETPELLEVLREAGVVDSGGLAVVILLDGLAAGLAGREPPPVVRAAPPRVESLDHPPSRYRYCTSFLVEGAEIDGDALEAGLLAVGDSVLVMGDLQQVKVHVHTDAPERAAGIAREWGHVGAMSIDDMRRQEAERAARLRRASATRARCGALLLADGAGVRELAEGLGAVALPEAAGAADIDAALSGLAADEAVIVAVGRTAGAAAVEAGSLPAALCCLVVLDPGLGATENAAGMAAAAAAVASVEIEGPPGALRTGLEDALAGLLGDGPALVTALIGAGAGVQPSEVEAWVRAAAGDAEVEVEAHLGGQARPALAIGVE